MPAFNSITADKLFRLIGTPGSPAVIDVRLSSDGVIPSTLRRSAEKAPEWARALQADSAVIVCETGDKESPGVAAWLRHEGIQAEILEGGGAAWVSTGLPVINTGVLPPRDSQGRTIWVTRARPKVDRIACPWLIRRFVDPDAVFLFVAPAEVAGVAEQFIAAPFDIDGTFWSHRKDLCTFDVMVREFGLAGFEPLQRLAIIIRGADTAQLEIAPQAAGLLAASLGLSRIYGDDLEQLEAGMLLYDAFYRWCRDAVSETHNWESHTPRSGRRG